MILVGESENSPSLCAANVRPRAVMCYVNGSADGSAGSVGSVGSVGSADKCVGKNQSCLHCITL